MTLETQKLRRSRMRNMIFLSIKLIDSHAKIPVKIFKIITSRAHIAHLENILWGIILITCHEAADPGLVRSITGWMKWSSRVLSRIRREARIARVWSLTLVLLSSQLCEDRREIKTYNFDAVSNPSDPLLPVLSLGMFSFWPNCPQITRLYWRQLWSQLQAQREHC